MFNDGGSAGYSALGAVSEHFKRLASSVFTRVGTYTLESVTQGLAGSGSTLYYIRDTGSTTIIRGINPETGAQTYSSDNYSAPSNPRGLAVVGNNVLFQ